MVGIVCLDVFWDLILIRILTLSAIVVPHIYMKDVVLLFVDQG